VVGKHLPVVLSWLFRVNNVELMEPPSELGEVVELSQGGEEGMWVSSTKGLWRKRFWGSHQDRL